MSKNAYPKWYLGAQGDSLTNENLVNDIIGAQNLLDSFRKGLLCADGEERDLYECPHGYSDVRKAMRNKSPHNNLIFPIEAFKEEIAGSVERFNLQERVVRASARRGRALKPFKKRLEKAKARQA